MANLTSFDHLWILLNPASEYAKKRADVQSLWSTIPLARQRVIYRIIQNKKITGQKLHPNPFFALEDNMNVEPEFLQGTQIDEAFENNIPLVCVHYNKLYKICTKQTMQDFGLEYHHDFKPMPKPKETPEEELIPFSIDRTQLFKTL